MCTSKFVCLHTLHYHHYANLSESIEHINAFHVYSVECAVRLGLTYQSFYGLYEAACVQLTNFSFGDCENICTLIFSSSSNHDKPLLSVSHQTPVCAV